LDGAFRGRTAGIEVVRAEVDPAISDDAVVDADLRSSARVVHPVELIGAIGTARYPGVDRVHTAGRNVRCVGRDRSFAGARGAREAIRDAIGGRTVIFVVIIDAGAIAPGSGERGSGRIVIDDNLVDLSADRTHRHDRCAGA
jgi:hypothetical protein